jgi:hypothetical protein
MKSWTVSSLVRIYPSTLPSRNFRRVIDVARNERFSFQLAVRNPDAEPISVEVAAGNPPGWTVRIRKVGYVPIRHLNTETSDDERDVPGCIPGFVPDPLFDGSEILVPPRETHSFWFSVLPASPTQPGPSRIKLKVKVGGRVTRSHLVRFRVHDVMIKPRRGFSVTNWFYLDALIDRYGTNLFDRAFWRILPRYLENLVDHGQDTLYVPVFTPPLDGVKRPSQLLRVSRKDGGGYAFDWRDVKRYVCLARQSGIEKFEWCHLFTQWGAKNAIHIYAGQGAGESLLWPAGTRATSQIYRRFLADYLPALHRFLKREALEGVSYHHVSDEPGEKDLPGYRRARELLGEMAPWMRVMDAVSEIAYGRSGLTDRPIPSIRTALDFAAEGIPSWCYYCCGPRGRYLNRLVDTPLAKIAMHGFLFYRWPFEGFLHWGCNYWYRRGSREMIDPFSVQDGHGWPNWAYGDTFVVYPGRDGPIDSIRWEVFGESLRTYALLQTLGIEPEDSILSPIRSFEDFPKTENWIHETRRRLFARRR